MKYIRTSQSGGPRFAARKFFAGISKPEMVDIYSIEWDDEEEAWLITYEHERPIDLTVEVPRQDSTYDPNDRY